MAALNDRQQLLQEVIEKMTGVMRGLHFGSGYLFKKYSLTRPYVVILFHLAKNRDGLSVKHLADRLHVTSGAVTQFLDNLFEKKLIVRKEDSEDRRTMRIRLSKAMQVYFNKFKKNYFKSVSPQFDKLTDKELRKLMSLMAKIKVEYKCSSQN